MKRPSSGTAIVVSVALFFSLAATASATSFPAGFALARHAVRLRRHAADQFSVRLYVPFGALAGESIGWTLPASETVIESVQADGQTMSPFNESAADPFVYAADRSLAQLTFSTASGDAYLTTATTREPGAWITVILAAD